jgi:hypothetical protein
MLDFVVEFEHPPELCPHSNAMVRKAFEDAVQGGALDALATRLGIEIVFAGFAVPGQKTYLVLRGPDYAAARRLLSKAGLCRLTASKFR